MAPIQLQCPARDCDYKTQPLDYEQAEKLLDIHVRVELVDESQKYVLIGSD